MKSNFTKKIVIFLFFLLILFIILNYYFYKRTENYENDKNIPLNIYQVWIGSKIPEKMQKLMDKIKEDNPEFMVKCFDDEESKNFLKENFEDDVLNAYNKLIPGSYKSDLMRFALLYKNGGIYLDAKMEPINGFKFKELIDNDHYLQDDNIGYISSYNNKNANVSTQIIISHQDNPIFMNCIRQIVENVKSNFYGIHTNEVTGPGILHKYLVENNILDHSIKVEKLNSESPYYITKSPYGISNAILRVNVPVYDEQVKNGIKGKMHEDLWRDMNIYN